MKLKPVVASLVMLGLMTPAFAKSSLTAQQAIIDSNSVISPVCSEGWFNRVSVGGVGSVVGITGNHDPAGTFTYLNNGSDIYVNDFSLLVNANLSSWSKATFNLAYLGAPVPWNQIGQVVAPSSGAPFQASYRYIKHSIVADEAYVQIGKLSEYPFFFVFGKKYIPFGEYTDPHTPYQIMSPVQALTQANAVTAIAGLTTNFGLYGSVYAFRGNTYPLNSQVGVIRNFGGKIGYYDNLEQLNVPGAHVNVNLSYLNNLWDTDVFSPNTEPQWTWYETGGNTTGLNVKNNHPVLAYATLNNSTGKSEYSIDPIGGIALHGDFAYKAFTLSANFASAIKKMVLPTYSEKAESSRFWAADVGATYSFKTLERNSNLGAGIQWTGNGSWFGDNALGLTDWVRIIPKWRLLGEYKINLFKNTDLGLVVAHSKSYDFISGTSVTEPAGARNTTLGLARLMVQF